MSRTRGAVALLLVAVALAGCARVPPPEASGATATPTDTAQPTLDLTAPGVAQQVVADLLAAAESRRAIMVTITPLEAHVAVVRDGVAETWAWRDEQIQQVTSDINYVAQVAFNPDDFNLSDVGALFRAAHSVSGTDANQELQIVEYSAGSVSMTVSTNPESRTVFFRPDGTLLPTLDFTSEWGLVDGYADAVGIRGVASALGFGSQVGVYLDAPAADPGTVVRRQRAARTPVIQTMRTEQAIPPTFDPALVQPEAVWSILERRQEAGSFTLDEQWSCLADDRADTGTPRIYCEIGDERLTADLSGTPIP